MSEGAASAAAQIAQVSQLVVAQTLSTVEAKLDDAIDKLDSLDANDITAIRKKRIADMQLKARKLQEWRALGHGQFHEVGDQKDWFAEVKANERVVCHFYRPTTWRCEIVDKHLEKLAAKHLETRFIKLNAEKSPFLCERLNVVLMPTILMTKDSHTLDTIEGFDDLGGTDKFTTLTLEKRLAQKGAIDIDEDAIAAARADDGDVDADSARFRKTHTSVKANKSGKAVFGSTRMANAEDD